jgi:hypothetical protein
MLWIEEAGLVVEGEPAFRRTPESGEDLVGDPFLYRALRADEIEAGCLLIPKGQGPFAPLPRRARDTRREAVEEQAVRQRVWRQRGCPSRGVSTTPHLHRAQFYARSEGVIVEIDRRMFKRCWVREYVVNDLLATSRKEITEPEDDEVILVCDLEGALPEEIMTRAIPASPPRAAAKPAVAHYAYGQY